MKHFFGKLLKSYQFWMLFSIVLIVRLGMVTYPKADPAPVATRNVAASVADPAPVATRNVAAAPESPFERDSQVIGVPSLEYTPLRAAEIGCNKPFSELINKLEENQLGKKVELYSHLVVPVEVAGVNVRLEVKATESGMVILNPQLPEGEIKSAYLSELESVYINFYYVLVELQDEPDLTSLTTPARVLCKIW